MTVLDSRAAATSDPHPPRQTVPFGPYLAAAGLVLGAGGNTLQPVLWNLVGGRPDTVAGQIALAEEHPAMVTAAHLAGTLAVPLMLVGFLAAAHLLARRARWTGRVAGVLLVLGMWGFMAVQTAEVVQLTALMDPEGVAAARYLHDMDSSLLLGIVFGVPFMLGAALGVVTLSVALLGYGAGVPRWIPALWLAFIVLDFTVGGVGPVDPHWLYFIGAAGLAHHILRDGAAAWWKH